MADAPLAGSALTAGQTALSMGAWTEAYARFRESLAARETPEALEGLSWATWWLEDVAACLEARERAYHRYRDAGDRRGAARMALWLGDDHAGFLGAYAVAEGWHGRAARILAELDPCPEHGWLGVFRAHAALEQQDLGGALRLAREGRDLGHQHGQVDLEMFGLATEGLVRIAQGEVRDGLRCLDEASASAVSGEYENLVPAAWSCCLVMGACEQLRDYQRAGQWCQKIDEFSRLMDARFVKGVCRAHYGAIQTWRGNWDLAEQALLEALEDLTDHRPFYRSEGLVRLAHLRYRQGRHSEAEALFEQAGDHTLALLGRAALSLDRNDPITARDLLERVLRQYPVETTVSRAAALELLVRANLMLGDAGAASGLLEELRAIAAAVSVEALWAAVFMLEGLLAAASGDHEQACDHFEDAIDRFIRSHAPVEAARARLGLAGSLVELGRLESAGREAGLALTVLESVEARVDIEQARTMLARLNESIRPESSQPLLTARQIEVLMLVSRGLSDQEIAVQMLLSPHTVHRHVANIFNRLSCSSRAAAVGEAVRLGLL
jgi:ATP/maltotriose-dependent transcriptional regulator MalT